MEEEFSVNKKRLRDEPEVDSPEVKRLRENLLESLYDDESEFCNPNLDLDSFMKSFEKEISDSGDSVPVSGDSVPDLGYLLEASDDDLGIPPSAAEKIELVVVDSSSPEIGADFGGFESDIPSFDSYEFGLVQPENFNGDYVALDGLFDYPDVGYGSGDFGWRFETLPAQ